MKELMEQDTRSNSILVLNELSKDQSMFRIQDHK